MLREARRLGAGQHGIADRGRDRRWRAGRARAGALSRFLRRQIDVAQHRDRGALASKGQRPERPHHGTLSAARIFRRGPPARSAWRPPVRSGLFHAAEQPRDLPLPDADRRRAHRHAPTDAGHRPAAGADVSRQPDVRRALPAGARAPAADRRRPVRMAGRLVHPGRDRSAGARAQDRRRRGGNLDGPICGRAATARAA